VERAHHVRVQPRDGRLGRLWLRDHPGDALRAPRRPAAAARRSRPRGTRIGDRAAERVHSSCTPGLELAARQGSGAMPPAVTTSAIAKAVQPYHTSTRGTCPHWRVVFAPRPLIQHARAALSCVTEAPPSAQRRARAVAPGRGGRGGALGGRRGVAARGRGPAAQLRRAGDRARQRLRPHHARRGRPAAHRVLAQRARLGQHARRARPGPRLRALRRSSAGRPERPARSREGTSCEAQLDFPSVLRCWSNRRRSGRPSVHGRHDPLLYE